MFRFWFLSLVVLGLVLTAALAPSPVMAASDLSASARTPVGTPRIVVRGSCTSGTNLTITLEGCSPPTTTPPVPPFMVVIRLNGWNSATPTPVWDDENQVWTITYKIPSGSRGAVIGITAMMFGTGNSTSASVTVQ